MKAMVLERPGERLRLVDLPGYGYAKVPLATKQQWQENLAVYLQGRQTLRGLNAYGATHRVAHQDHPIKPQFLDDRDHIVGKRCH